MAHEQHCPHCLAVVAKLDGPYPPAAMRCPSCRLLIAAARCRGPEGIIGLGRSSAAAAGVMASQARRAEAEPGDREQVVADLRAVAETTGVRVERLRMTDYDVAQREGLVELDVAVVLATFGSWKAARRAAHAPPANEDDLDLGEELAAG